MKTKVSKVKSFLQAVHSILIGFYDALYCFVLFCFRGMNRKARSKISVWWMKQETSEHVHLVTRVFKWVILPASILYVCANFYFFGENALDSMLWGQLIFFYSNFLPDLPSIYRRKRNNERIEDVSRYKEYALLLFAPLFIWLTFSGTQLRWKTTETFHNFKSLTIYGAFLFACSFFAFVNFPISIGNITKILSLPFYGLIGYLTHLKVDKIW